MRQLMSHTTNVTDNNKYHRQQQMSQTTNVTDNKRHRQQQMSQRAECKKIHMLLRRQKRITIESELTDTHTLPVLAIKIAFHCKLFSCLQNIFSVAVQKRNLCHRIVDVIE